MKRCIVTCVLVALTCAGWAEWKRRATSMRGRDDTVPGKVADKLVDEPPGSYRGPIKRQEPVGWVFGRLVGVDPKAMSPFKSAGP